MCSIEVIDMAICAVCGKPATKYDGWMVGNNGVKQYSSPDTFGWCDEHYKNRHKYKMIFESQTALELWKSRVPHLYAQLSPDEILLVHEPESVSIEVEATEEILEEVEEHLPEIEDETEKK